MLVRIRKPGPWGGGGGFEAFAGISDKTDRRIYNPDHYLPPCLLLAFGEKTFLVENSLYLSCSSLALQVQLLKDEAEDLGEKVVDGRPISLLQLLAFYPASQTQRVLT